jgi:hypothetical protein
LVSLFTPFYGVKHMFFVAVYACLEKIAHFSSFTGLT